ncbi:unnamed protein product (macronuclear) [Paramecium tetraurelia]|uniref:EF-hand domain-containing protein n=1 Tax=Paramecium tetraurelia TaxID=5888 RepID=A0CF76_PARTE|nr:uncharacterized protein GSPATT00037882001 [Paramecium tetraurelia]CAK69443.1 unnamed protein product [Paramecium tetraurelia]|eukprot:XP_001436840.1 hypothetical protein (macronuclear) [Paramecium tetraurelia strain d4-2]
MINLSDREKELIEEICAKNNKSNKKSNQDQGSQKLVSQSSTKILVSKLERKLNDTLKEVDEQNSGQIDFQQLGRLFTLLDIFQAISGTRSQQSYAKVTPNLQGRQQEVDLHEKAFAIISNDEEKVDIQAAFCLFRIILDPNQLEPSKCAILIKEYLEKISDKEFDFEAIHKFCSEFQAYQKTRLSGAKIGYLKASLAQNLIETYEKTLTFKPTINPISEALQQQSGKKENQESSSQLSSGLAESRVNELYKKKELSNQKIEFLKQEKLMKDMQECTFKPQIISKKELPNVVDRLYQVKNRQEIEERAKIAEQEKEESEYSKCSFHPQINYSMPESQSTGIGGYWEAIERMRRANDRKHLKDLKLNHKPSGENYEKVKNQPFSPPEMLQRGQLKKELPILYIDIKLGPRKVGRLALRRNDDVEEVVKSFCKVWGVGQQDYELLVNQVRENLQSVIQETDESQI